MINSTAIQVSWDPPYFHMQNGIITSYTVSVLELLTGMTWLFQQSQYYNTYIIGGLHPYYSYQVMVAANTINTGPEASTVLTTQQDGKVIYF